LRRSIERWVDEDGVGLDQIVEDADRLGSAWAAVVMAASAVGDDGGPRDAVVARRVREVVDPRRDYWRAVSDRAGDMRFQAERKAERSGGSDPA
jgi:hypothetical protein